MSKLKPIFYSLLAALFLGILEAIGTKYLGIRTGKTLVPATIDSNPSWKTSIHDGLFIFACSFVGLYLFAFRKKQHQDEFKICPKCEKAFRKEVLSCDMCKVETMDLAKFYKK